MFSADDLLVLAIAFLMNYAGATATLELALAKTGKICPFFSIMLGWMGFPLRVPILR